MEVEILVYEHEPLLPSITPKRFADGSLCQAALGCLWACSGFAAEDAVDHMLAVQEAGQG